MTLTPIQSQQLWLKWSRLTELAPPRFAKYGPLAREGLSDAQAGEAALEALSKVAWNMCIAESLTPILQAVEIALRNYIDGSLRLYLKDHHESPSGWMMAPPDWLHRKDSELIENARAKLDAAVRQGLRGKFGHNDVLASASFVLWSNMIQNNHVWKALCKYKGGRLTRGQDRKSLHKTMDDIRNLRNRAYHLEPVFCQSNLEAVYAAAKEKLEILEPRLSRLAHHADRFPDVYDKGLGWRQYQTAIRQDLS